MNIEFVLIDKIIPYARNQRKHSDDQVKKIASSIREFGFKNPVIVDKNMSIIAGHGRVLAAEKLGLDKVPVIVADDLNEAQVKAYRLADNRLQDLSEFDDELVKLELEELRLDDFNLDLTGFDDKLFDDDISSFEDKSEEMDTEYNVIVEFENEEDQQRFYEEKLEEGYKCKISIL